jgi:hypothetical protein
MIISRYDTQVPTSAQMRTWKAFGRPQAYFSSMRHLALILSIPLTYYSKIESFLKLRFDPDA